MERSLFRRWAWCVLGVIALALGCLPANPARGATAILYVSATGHYVRGVFRDFWDTNGGVANFGYPITEEYVDARTNRIYQFFERARFERASVDATTVDLGLIGREVAGNREFATAEQITSSATRRYFPETKHIVQYGFKETWEKRGGVRVFGLPISDELDEQLADGKAHTVQYFERARFEYWPDQPAGQRVLLSLLGRQLAPRELTAPLAPNSPPTAPIGARPAGPTTPTVPSLVRPVLPASRNAQVLPQAGQPGDTFVLDASGFQAGEKVGVWVTAPNGAVVGAGFQATANANGSIAAAKVNFATSKDMPLGVWSFAAQGVTSGKQAVGYFLLIAGELGRLPVVAPQPGVPANVDARVEPAGGKAGTIFFFDATGFRPGEEVTLAVVASDGRTIDAGYTVKADQQGGIGYVGLYYVTEPNFPLGLWSFVAKGKDSGKTSTGYFVLTP